MKLGIGLPNHIAGVAGGSIAEWARRAETRGFESLATIDRLRYPGLDSLIALAAAAGASTDVTLVTNVLLAPVYPVVPLAKQIAGVAQISGGRLVIGLGVGNRRDDYASTGTDFDRRGKILDEQVEQLRGLWTDTGTAAVCAAPISVPLLFGGHSAATVRRVTTVGDGWAAGAVRHYDIQAELVARIQDGWVAAGRSGRPYLQASVNFGMGPDDIVDAGKAHLARYYGFSPEYAQVNIDDMVCSADEARATVRRYRDMGFDRLLFHPTTAGLDQLDRLADAIL